MYTLGSASRCSRKALVRCASWSGVRSPPLLTTIGSSTKSHVLSRCRNRMNPVWGGGGGGPPERPRVHKQEGDQQLHSLLADVFQQHVRRHLTE